MSERFQGWLRLVKLRRRTLALAVAFSIAAAFFWTHIDSKERSLTSQAGNLFTESLFLVLTLLIVDFLVRRESHRTNLVATIAMNSPALYPIADYFISVRDSLGSEDYNWLRNLWRLHFIYSNERRRSIESSLADYCLMHAADQPGLAASLQTLSEIVSRTSTEFAYTDAVALRELSQHLHTLHELIRAAQSSALDPQHKDKHNEKIVQAFKDACLRADDIDLVGTVYRSYVNPSPRLLN